MTTDSKPRIIRESDLSAYVHCPYSVHLDDIINSQKIPMSAFTAREAWFSMGMRKLFPEDTERFVGPELVPVESLRGEDLQQHLGFNSPESFGKGMKGLWFQHVITNNGPVHDRPVAWHYRNQWWKIASEIRKGSAAFYQHILDEGLPNLAFFSSPVDFEFKGYLFRTKFDEIRPGGVITDHGLPLRLRIDTANGSNHRTPNYDSHTSITQEDVNRDLRITLRLLAFSVLTQREFFQHQFAIEPFKGPGVMRTDISYEYHNVLTGEILRTSRTDADVEMMLSAAVKVQDMIDGAKGTGKLETKLASCYVCKYNVLDQAGDAVCRRRNARYAPMLPMSAFPDAK